MITVIVNPSSVSVHVGKTQQFSAVVNGSQNKSVTWKATLGMIDTNGRYTAPDNTGNDSVTAIAVADAQVSGFSKVAITS